MSQSKAFVLVLLHTKGKILQTLPTEKVSCEVPIKPKGWEVSVLNWHGAKDRVRDYVAHQYVLVADSTKSLSTKDYPDVTLGKRYFNIQNDNGVTALRKIPHSKSFKRLFCTINTILT